MCEQQRQIKKKNCYINKVYRRYYDDKLICNIFLTLSLLEIYKPIISNYNNHNYPTYVCKFQINYQLKAIFLKLFVRYIVIILHT
jgi:hypothetical protein